MIADIINAHDSRMIHFGHNPRFSFKTFRCFRTQKVGCHNLDRHISLQQGITREVNDSHSSPANFTQDLVTVRKS